MSEPLSEHDLAAIEAAAAECAATESVHRQCACHADLPRLLAEVRRLRAALQAEGE